MTARAEARARDELARRRLANQQAERLEARSTTIAGRGRYAHLTAKQREAARLWADGYTIRETATELGVSSTAVAVRVRAAQRKLGLSPGGTARDRRKLRAVLAGVRIEAAA